jgi:L-ornithine N5-oxygenase
MNERTNEPYALVCAGFGPAAIAVAAAIEDAIRGGRLAPDVRDKVVFLEKAPRTEWKGGLLLPGTNINHSEYRDLATPRDPASPFTFAQFLKATGNLYNRGAWTGAVGRIEWSKYVSWVADQLKSYVRYSEPAVAIDTRDADRGDLLTVTSSKGSYVTRQVMIACGMEAYTPEAFHGAPPELVRHADQFLYYRAEVDARIRAHGPGPFRIAIVGSGLSAAEIMHDLLARHDPELVEVTSLHRGMAFRHYDMSQFSNIVFKPEEMGRFHAADPVTRRHIQEKTYATNFGGVDAECAAAEWNFLYERKLMGIDNARVMDRHQIEGARVSGDGERMRLTLRDEMSGRPADPLEADLVILCTGYSDTVPDRLLAGLGHRVEREFDGLLSIAENHRLNTEPSLTAPIWLNGHGEHAHGVASTQSFSLIAHKAERLFHSMFVDTAGRAGASEEAGQRGVLQMASSV